MNILKKLKTIVKYSMIPIAFISTSAIARESSFIGESSVGKTFAISKARNAAENSTRRGEVLLKTAVEGCENSGTDESPYWVCTVVAYYE